MILNRHLFGYRIKFVFRHRWENRDILDLIGWRTKRLGVWYKTYETVSKPKNGPAILGKNGSTSTMYMFGMDLIVCKFWFDICYRPLELKIK